MKRNRKPAIPIYRPPIIPQSETSTSENGRREKYSEDYFILEVEDANRQFHRFKVFSKDKIEDVAERMGRLCDFNQQFIKALEKRLQSEFNRFSKLI